jgi:hypothetical protein
MFWTTTFFWFSEMTLTTFLATRSTSSTISASVFSRISPRLSRARSMTEWSRPVRRSTSALPSL